MHDRITSGTRWTRDSLYMLEQYSSTKSNSTTYCPVIRTTVGTTVLTELRISNSFVQIGAVVPCPCPYRLHVQYCSISRSLYFGYTPPRLIIPGARACRDTEVGSVCTHTPDTRPAVHTTPTADHERTEQAQCPIADPTKVRE